MWEKQNIDIVIALVQNNEIRDEDVTVLLKIAIQKQFLKKLKINHIS